MCSLLVQKGVKAVFLLKFQAGGHWYDSYWQKTGSGLLHEWRFDEPTGADIGKDVHYVFKPMSKFEMADCDSENLLRSFSWTAHSYPESTDDEAGLDDFLVMGDRYRVCVYEEVE